MSNHRHFILHKPFGYLSQFVCPLKNKKLLGELFDFPLGTMAIGRLDEDSEGLLLLSTDGKMSEHFRSKQIEKEYCVQIEGICSEDAISQLTNGVEIGIRNQKYLTKNCMVIPLQADPGFTPRIKKIRDARHGPTSWITITLTEGKERQVRKMTAKVGHPTLRLMRVRIGEWRLNGLKAGNVKEVDHLIVLR